MKYRLNDDVKNFIKSIVNPNNVDWYICKAEELAIDNNIIKLCIRASDSMAGLSLTLRLCRDARFTEVVELKPYIWYSKEKFDNNPNKYLLIEKTSNGTTLIWEAKGSKDLFKNTTHFMYVEGITHG